MGLLETGIQAGDGEPAGHSCGGQTSEVWAAVVDKVVPSNGNFRKKERKNLEEYQGLKEEYVESKDHRGPHGNRSALGA